MRRLRLGDLDHGVGEVMQNREQHAARRWPSGDGHAGFDVAPLDHQFQMNVDRFSHERSVAYWGGKFTRAGDVGAGKRVGQKRFADRETLLLCGTFPLGQVAAVGA